MKWRIYYADGSTYSDADGDPFDAPALGALVVACEDATVGRILVYGHSFYFWYPEHERWWAGNLLGLVNYLTKPGPRRVLIGEEVPNPKWDAAIERASADDYLPPKTAFHPAEKRLLMFKD